MSSSFFSLPRRYSELLIGVVGESVRFNASSKATRVNPAMAIGKSDDTRITLRRRALNGNSCVQSERQKAGDAPVVHPLFDPIAFVEFVIYGH
jgi:hypothetical protein